MTYKTRKHIWPVPLVASIAILGVLAAFLVLANNPGVTMAQDGADPCAGLTDDERSDFILDGGTCGVPEPEPTPEPTPVVVTEDDASAPVMFQAEGLDNGARLNWREPKLRAPGATVIGYQVVRDAWNANPDHPINDRGDDAFYLLNLSSVLAVDYHDRGLAYNTAYTYWVRAVVEYNLAYWWDNLDCGMMNAVVDPRSGEPTVASGAYCNLYKNLSAEAKPVVQRAYNLQDGKHPVSMVDTWWNDLNCMEMNDAVSPGPGEPMVGSDDPNNDPPSPYCAMYDDLSPAAAQVVRDAHYNDYGRYRHGHWASGRTIMTSTSGGLLDALLAPPSAPTGVDAEASCDDQIMVTWDPPTDLGKVPSEFPGCAICTNQTPIHIGGDDAGIEVQPGTAMITSYMVERKVGNGSWMIVAHDLPATARYWTDSDEDLAYGMTYHYRVRATNNANLTGPAGMVTMMLVEPNDVNRPQNLRATVNDEGNVLLQWTAPIGGNDKWYTGDDEDETVTNGDLSKRLSYRVERISTAEPISEQAHQYGPRSFVTETNPTRVTHEQTYTDDEVDAAANSATYVVYAIVDACQLSEGNSVTLDIETTAPGMPTGLMAEEHGDRVDLSWTAPADPGARGDVRARVTSYQIERHSGDGNFSIIVEANATTTYTDLAVTEGTTYTYRVSATNNFGKTGAASAIVTAMPEMRVLGTPSITAASNAAGSATIALAPAANATKHFVWAFRVGGTDNATDGMWSGQAAGDATSVTMTGLTSGASYWFIAIAGRGDGDQTEWSAWSSWTAPVSIQ